MARTPLHKLPESANMIREYVMAGKVVKSVQVWRDDQTGVVKPYEIWACRRDNGQMVRNSSFKTSEAAIASAEKWRDQVAAGEYDRWD